ncbi:MAG: metallophosphoesterase family protein [Megasphaera sp.]|jgi:hypothetical protein|nr:metallophosphoesterase family protein [Megasphaera sp.]MCH4188369.1 metallophosphoesterase family protein [Megasphaera sp.]MCH4218208.1 metallophosphoesterase family protein [Megasphaera sp.]
MNIKKTLHKKTIAKILIPFVIIACAAAYAFVPGAKTVTQQSMRATKAVAAHYELTDTVDAMNIRQIITKDSTTTRTFMWQSQLEESDAVVEYRIKGTGEALAMPATNETFTDDNTTTYIHTAAIRDLQPGTDYEYRVGYGKKRSDWTPFRTAQGHDFKALIFPDSQSSDYSVWAQTEQPAWQANPDAQFFINMGDLVDNGQDHYQWNAWFDVVSSMISRIPAAPVMGNHETYDKDWKVRMPEAYLHLFALPKITPETYQNQYYSFDYGDVHFIVLNTQMTEMTQFQPNMQADEIDWFKKDIEQTTKKWKVIIMHKDPLQYAFNSRPEPRAEGFSAEGKTWMPLFDQYGVDVVLSAHLHTYRNRGHIRDFQHDDAGPLYILTGVAGNVRYPSLWKQHRLDEYVAPQPETDNYMTMEAKENSLTFKAFLPSGEELDTVSVTKE